jgi:glycosyltransferase involved in cell wall biosynthesis
MPLVSVIIPTYNRADLLPEAIRSVLSQTITDFELIIVDDGSSDDTRQLVETFADPRIRYIYQENKGISGAMNTGLGAARGDYIARLDSDDRWLPTILAEQLAIFEAHPEIGIVYAKAQAMDINGNPMAQTLGAPGHFPGQTFKSLLYGDFGSAISTLVRRECYERIGGYDTHLKANEDWDVWIRLARYYPFYFLDQVLANFRYHPGRSTASSLFGDVLLSRLRPLDKAFAEPDLPTDILDVKPLAYRNAHMDIALRWMGVKNNQQARHHFAQAMRVSGRPISTLLRIAWLILFYRYLSKRRWGVRMVEGLVRFRHRFSQHH